MEISCKFMKGGKNKILKGKKENKVRNTKNADSGKLQPLFLGLHFYLPTLIP